MCVCVCVKERERKKDQDMGVGRKDKPRRKLEAALKVHLLQSCYLTLELTGITLNIIIYELFFQISCSLRDNPEIA